MPITEAEIARICNVSRTTVDRALKNKPGIRPETRERICAVARQHDYRPNFLASSLSTGRTHSIGVIVFDLYNQHFSQLVNAIEGYFFEIGIYTYICLSHKDKQRESDLIRSLIDRQVDGILLVPINDGESYSSWLRSLSVPIVAISNRLPGLPFVSGDNRDGVYRGMEQLYACGLRTVYFVCPPLRYKGTENLYAQEMRAAGYTEFMNAHPDMMGEPIVSANYQERVLELLRDAPERPGIFCSSDLFMLAIRKRIIDLGWDVDGCCALMGMDGLDFLDHLTNRPPSVMYPAGDIGQASAKLLDDLMNHRPAQQEILLPCPINLGSTGI